MEWCKYEDQLNPYTIWEPQVLFRDACSVEELLPRFVAEGSCISVHRSNYIVTGAIHYHTPMVPPGPATPQGQLHFLYHHIIRNMHLRLSIQVTLPE